MWPFKKAPLNCCIVGTRMNTGQFCQQFTNRQYLASASRGNLPSRHSGPGEPERHTRVASSLGKAKTPRYLLNGNRISGALQHLGVNSHFMFMRLPCQAPAKRLKARPFAAAQGFACGFSPQYAQKPAGTGDPGSRFAHARKAAQSQTLRCRSGFRLRILTPVRAKTGAYRGPWLPLRSRTQSGSNCQRTVTGSYALNPPWLPLGAAAGGSNKKPGNFHSNITIVVMSIPNSVKFAIGLSGRLTIFFG
jgi:hypothetical protein